MDKVDLILKYSDLICQAIDCESELFSKRIALVCGGQYGSKKFQAIEHQLEKLGEKIKDLNEQVLRIL